MGLYINPIGQTKEEWLGEHGARAVPVPDMFEAGQEMEPKHYPVCLIQNSLFTAAGICFSQREYEEFRIEDGRRKIWFMVNEDDLDAVAGLRDHLKSYLR